MEVESTFRPEQAAEQQPQQSVTTLENGLTVIVREDHAAPVVSAQAWCMAGSIHEEKWLGAGLSHVLEHMLFKGTTTRPGSRIDQEVQEAGGYMNAYTSFDRTVYHIDVPNTGPKVAIDLLCDIMRNASLPEDELAKEKQVILREMDMNIDDPARRASRRLFETAYTKSPCRFTIIGYPDIFNELKPEDIRAYYQGKYVPNNVFFVVVGDVSTEEVLAQIREAYSKTKAKPLAPAVLPEEPRQTAPREVVEEAPIELGYLHYAWHIPEVRHPDAPALDVLAAVLGSGRSSRFYRELRQKQGLVNSIDAWTYSPTGTGLFGVSATVEGPKHEAARGEMLKEIEKARNGLVETAELRKAVKQFVSATLAARKTMQGQAQDLGSNWLTANDLGFSERYLAAIRSVTPDDLQRVARQYLTPENRTLYALLPEGSVPARQRVRVSSQDHPVTRFELGNGLRLLVKEEHRLPFVEFRVAFMGGSLTESPETNGVTQLTGRMLLKGTAARTADEIALSIESVGGSIDSYGGNNSFGVNAEVLSEDFQTGLGLVGDVLLNPVFPAEPLEREREVLLATIRAQKDHPLQLAVKSMRQGLFGPTGYGLDSLGTEAAVAQLTSGHLKDYHLRLAAPNNCVMAIYGDIEKEAVREAVERVFGGWKPTVYSAGAQPGQGGPLRGQKRVGLTVDKKQAVLVLGFAGTTLAAADRYALELLQEACSDLGSRLFLRIREKLGLAYYVGAQNFVGLVPGYFAFYAGTAPEKADLVEKELFAEVDTLRNEGLTEEELARAKAKVIGQKKIARQDLGGLAQTMALDELYGLGYAHIDSEDALYDAVTLEQVKQAARTYLTPEQVVISRVEPR